MRVSPVSIVSKESHTSMTSLKLAFVVLLAFGAIQCQSANVPEPEPRDLDVFLAAQNVIKIARNVVAAVEKGIKDSQPSIDIVIKQLTPELGKAVKKLFDKALDLFSKEKARIEVVIKEVESLLDAMKKIKSCTDPSKKDLEKVLAKFEDGLLLAVRSTLKNHAENVELAREGFYRLLNSFRTLFDKEIKTLIECIKPGHPNAQKCIDDELKKIKNDLIKLGGKVVMFIGEVKETFSKVADELVTKVLPLTETFQKDVDPVMKKISDCIAKMK